MASAFSYTFDLSPDLRCLCFEAERANCLLTHQLTWTQFGNTILTLSVDCFGSERLLVTAEVCSDSIGSVKKSCLPENGTAVMKFQNIDFMTDDPWRCIVHLIPHLQLDVSVSVSDSQAKTATKAEKVSRLEQLSADFRQLQLSEELSDVVLLNDDVRIPAHKVVLSARSPVFARMFRHVVLENSENVVRIPDISGDVLQELVAFMYTGTVTIPDGAFARHLYAAADKYEVAGLRALCSGLLKTPTADDVLDTLSLADLYDDQDLKRASLSFVSRNFSSVKASKNWERFSKENQALAIEILSFVIESKT